MINPKEISSALEKIYNTMGNNYLTSNFITEPFEFKVNFVRTPEDESLWDYVIRVESTPKMPESLEYRNKKTPNGVDGVHKSVVQHNFKKYIYYIDPTFGSFRKTVGLVFV